MYNRDKIYQQAKKQITKHNLFFIEDIVAFLPCSKQTFYEFFPINSDEMDTIKDLLEENKVKTKSSIRAKLWKSNKAAELLALYRLIATPEEHRLLNQTYIESRNKNTNINQNDYSNYSDEDLKQIEEITKKYDKNEDD